MCPPGLHITLGIFMRLFVLLEEDCHKLDQCMRIQGGDKGPSYEKYSSAMDNTRALKDEQQTLKDALQLLEQLLTHSLVTGCASSVSNPLILELVSEIQKRKGRMKDIVSPIAYIPYFKYSFTAYSKLKLLNWAR